MTDSKISPNIIDISLGGQFDGAVIHAGDKDIHIDQDGKIRILGTGQRLQMADIPEITTVPEIEPVMPMVEREAEEERRYQETGSPEMKVGQTIEGKGVYLGQWEPIDYNRETLGKIFNLYAAPTDLIVEKIKERKKLFSREIVQISNEQSSFLHEDAIEEIAKITKLMGHDGIEVKNDRALYDLLSGDGYGGQWFMPTIDIIEDFLYPSRGVRDLLHSFKARWYWSLSQSIDDGERFHCFYFLEGRQKTLSTHHLDLAIRLVRAEPV